MDCATPLSDCFDLSCQTLQITLGLLQAALHLLVLVGIHV